MKSIVASNACCQPSVTGSRRSAHLRQGEAGWRSGPGSCTSSWIVAFLRRPSSGALPVIRRAMRQTMGAVTELMPAYQRVRGICHQPGTSQPAGQADDTRPWMTKMTKERHDYPNQAGQACQ